MLTAAQQDYLETIWHLEKSQGTTEIRISDIAAELGTRLPTVSRTVRRLTDLGVLDHRQRRHVTLTEQGRRIAADVAHRHDDIVKFFMRILGLPREVAETDACQIEHGISARTAQRLHEFLIFFKEQPEDNRRLIMEFQELASKGKSAFRHIPERKTAGWRS